MTDSVKIGNVSFYKSDIKSTSVTYKNGEKINCVWLNNGTKMQFKDQKADSRASVTTGYDAGNENKYGTGFSNITGLSIEGTDKNDYYHIFNCQDYNVDVKDGKKDEVRIAGDTKNLNGTVNADVSDKVNFVDTSKIMSMSEGFFMRTQE